jgi:hypothetical protein
MSRVTVEQHAQLLKGINPSRVASRKGGGGKSLAYVEAWDIKAHMIRIFGFAGWSWDVIAADLVFEEKGDRNWEVGYRVIGSLTVAGATYTEAAVGIASLPSRGEAHDMAVKTGESDAFKRAAINLGDQFGLSLYNGGSTGSVVRATLVNPGSIPVATPEIPVVPVTGEEPDTDATEPKPAAVSHVETEPAPEGAGIDTEGYVVRLREAAAAGDVAGIVTIKAEIASAGALEAVHDGKTLSKIVDLAVVHAGRVTATATLDAEEVSE